MTGACTSRRVEQWYRDPISCLQSTVGTVLLDAGADPLGTLGLHWGFRHIPGDVRPEEFYLPCDQPGDLVGSLLPHHPITSTWRIAPPEDPVAALEEALADHRLPIVAVDNFHLPFRPAYHDVHAAHLIVVFDVDRAGGTAWVSDAMPPAHLGPLPIDDLVRSWRSSNPPDEQDVFFSGSGIDARWLDVRFHGRVDVTDRERLADALRDNVSGFTERGSATTGLDGLAAFGADLVDSAAAGDGDALAAAYTFGWSAQAQASLHGELLRRCGAEWDLPELAEAGRLAERAAHLWTPVRVTSAHGRNDPRAWTVELASHTSALHDAYRVAIDEIGKAACTL